MEQIYNKLVRDNIPNIIKNNNEEPIFRVLNDDENKQALKDKLYEEYQELISASNTENLIEECIDMLEIIFAILETESVNINEGLEQMKLKSDKKGGFTKKIFLEKVITNK